MNQNEFPPGWDENRVKGVISHYESQSEDEAVAEDEAAFEPHGQAATNKPTDLLLWVCDALHASARKAAKDRKREDFGEKPPFELLVFHENHVRVVMRKEQVGHHEPHLHIKHSDKIDASISLRTFDVLAGKIDSKTHKHFRTRLKPKQSDLLAAWEELNEKDNSVMAEQLIKDIAF
jgi:hypothetical protein